MVTSIFSAVVLYYSCYMTVVQAQSDQVTAALHVPMAIPYFALVISFAIITCVQGVSAIMMIARLRTSGADAKGGE